MYGWMTNKILRDSIVSIEHRAASSRILHVSLNQMTPTLGSLVSLVIMRELRFSLPLFKTTVITFLVVNISYTLSFSLLFSFHATHLLADFF